MKEKSKSCFIKIFQLLKNSICFIVGLYLILGLSFNWFRRDFNLYEYIGILIGIILIILPQISRIKIGNILELENKIEETKDEFKRYQDITTNLLTQISTTNNFTNQNIIYNFPSKTKIDEDDLKKVIAFLKVKYNYGKHNRFPSSKRRICCKYLKLL